ncbi:hypothetical protein PHYSODRAFT_528799, partial [Phytophthora sojae]
FRGGLSGSPLLHQRTTRGSAAECSSTAAELNFSTHKFIQSTMCNRFKEGSVEKLGFILSNA